LLIVHSVSWKGGGAFFHALHISKGLAKLGHEVSIFSTSKKSLLRVNRSIVDEVKLIEFPDLLFGSARNGWDLYNILRRCFYIRRERFDMVHALDTRPVVIFPALIAKYFFKSKLVIEWLDWFGKNGTATERSKYIKWFMLPIETFFEEKFRKFADGSIGLGLPLTNRALEYSPKSKVLTITHGCDIDNIKTYHIEYAREKIKLNKCAYYLGYTGRLREDVIIRLNDIVKHLNEMNIPGKIYCILIGNPAFKYQKYLDDGAKEFFITTGWITYEEVNYYMSACNILMLPFNGKSVARNGIWPSKLNDYLAVGRPILCTKLDVLRETFEKYRIGFMVDDNTEHFIRKVKELLLNEEQANTFGVNARELAETDFNWNRIVNKIDTFYKNIK